MPAHARVDATADDPLYAKTLGSGIEVLLVLADGPIGLREMSNRLGLSRSKAYRLVHTLSHHGLVTRDTGERYRLTTRLWEIGVRVIDEAGVKEAARAVVRRLSDAYGETVHLSIYENGEVLYIDKANGWHPISAYTRLGGRAPAYAVATGKALLAHQRAEEVAAVAGRGLIRFTSLTITDADALTAELQRIRLAGYAVNRGEWRDGVGGIGVVLRNQAGKVFAALGFSGPAERILERREELADALVDAASEFHDQVTS